MKKKIPDQHIRSESRNSSLKRKNVFWYSVVLVLALFFRFVHLDKIPSGLVSDELDYVLNAKTIYLTGKNIQDTWTPFSLTPIAEEQPKAELPYLVSVPFVGPFSFSLLHAKFGYAIISVIFVFAVLSIAHTLFGFPVSIIAGIIAAINPWSIYFGRTAYDVPIAVTAYILGVAFLLRFKRVAIWLSLLLWSIAFYSYIGMKLLFLPFVYTSLAFGYWFHKETNHKAWYILAALIASIFFVHYVYSIQASGVSTRLNQLFTPYSQDIIGTVDAQRRLVLDNPLIVLVSNKYIVYGKEILGKFFGAFNPNLLFVSGEGVATFSLWEHGLFYPMEAIFLIVGLIAMWIQKRAISIWILVMIAISTIPSLFSTVGVSYVHRSSLMYPFFLIAIAYGIWSLYTRTQVRMKLFFLVIIIFFYMVSLGNFSYTYFFRFPYYNSEAFGLSARIYSRLSFFAEKKNIPVVFLANPIEGHFRNYLFYNDAITRISLPSIRQSFREKRYVIDNVTFTSVCPSIADVLSKQAMYIFNESTDCKELFIGKETDVITSLADGGTLHRIYNDEICGKYPLLPYPQKFILSDFAVESLSEDAFCKQFIIRYTEPLYLPTVKK